jgi:hypothetical protein
MEKEKQMKELEELKPTITEIDQLVNAVNATTIKTADDYLAAGMWLKDLKERKKAMTEKRLAITRPLDKSKSEIMEFFKPALEKIEEAINQLDQGKMIPWKKEQDRIAAQEMERLRLLALEEANKQRLQEIDEAIKTGDIVTAEELAETPVEPMQVYTSTTAIPKSKEVFTRSTWSAEIVDIDTLFRAVAKGEAPRECFMVDMPFLNAQARAFKKAFNIPGVKAVEKESTTGR